jgi:hypothetical protein
MKNNEWKLWKTVRLGACFSLMLGLASCGGERAEVAEEEAGVEQEAVGETAMYDRDRFNTDFTSTNNYEEWDANRDNFFDENEFYGGFYDTWDVNDDNRLDQDEFNTAASDFGAVTPDWNEWDANKDNQLDENEFRTGFGKSNYYSQWDADKDNRLNDREYSEGVFGLWDREGRGSLEEADYNTRYNRYYGNRDM